MKRLRSWKTMRLENEILSNCSLNIGRWKGRGAFSLENFVMFICKRNYFVLQRKNYKFACWREWNVECINATQGIILKRNYFVFSHVSFTVRMFNFLNLCFVKCSSVSFGFLPLWVRNVAYKMIGYLVIWISVIVHVAWMKYQLSIILHYAHTKCITHQ